MKMKHARILMAVFVLSNAVGFMLLLGYWVRTCNDAPTKKLSQREADFQAATILVATFNSIQTNWMLTLTAKQPPQVNWTPTMDIAISNGQAAGYDVIVHTNEDGGVRLEFSKPNSFK